MSELMKASEARKIIDSGSDTAAISLKQEATRVITAAVKQGLSKTDLSIPHTHIACIKAWLESFGYRVEVGSDYRDSWFTVFW